MEHENLQSKLGCVGERVVIDYRNLFHVRLGEHVLLLLAQLRQASRLREIEEMGECLDECVLH